MNRHTGYSDDTLPDYNSEYIDERAVWLVNEMATDTVAPEVWLERLLEVYRKCDNSEKRLVNRIMTIITGWQLTTIMEPEDT